MTVNVNVEKGMAEAKRTVEIGEKRFVIELSTELLPNGKFIDYEWRINEGVYYRGYTELAGADTRLEAHLEKIVKAITAAEQLNIPIIAGDYALEYVNEVVFEGFDFENDKALKLIEAFLEHHSLDELPEGSLSGGEIIIYSGIMDTVAEETSFGVDLFGLVEEDDVLNFFEENNGRLESSVKSFAASTTLKTVMDSFVQLIKAKESKKAGSEGNKQ